MFRYAHPRWTYASWYRITTTWSVWLENYLRRFWEPGYLVPISFEPSSLYLDPDEHWHFRRMRCSSCQSRPNFPHRLLALYGIPQRSSSIIQGVVCSLHSCFGTVDEYILVACYRRTICIVLIFCSVSFCTCSIKNSSSYNWETCTSY